MMTEWVCLFVCQSARLTQQGLLKVIWEEGVAQTRSHTLCNEVPICCNGTPKIHPQNSPFPFDDHHPKSWNLARICLMNFLQFVR